MKKYNLQITFILITLFSTAVSFAQGDFGDEEDPNPTDAPIGDYLWIVALIGLAFVFFRMRNKIQVQK